MYVCSTADLYNCTCINFFLHRSTLGIRPWSFDLHIRSDTLGNVINVVPILGIFRFDMFARARFHDYCGYVNKVSAKILWRYRVSICLLGVWSTSKHGRALCPSVITADDRWYILWAIIMPVIRIDWSYRMLYTHMCAHAWETFVK